MVSERKFIAENIKRALLKEFLISKTERAGFGGLDIQRTPMGTRVTLTAERPGMVIGRRGATINELTRVMEQEFKFDNPQIEVQECKNPNLNPVIMAQKLAAALERGWHFRRAGHSTVRKIMGSGAKGCQVVLSGKLTGRRHRTEKFKEGHIKFCGHPKDMWMWEGYAVAKKKLGVIGVKVQIMDPDAKLPDEIVLHKLTTAELEALKAAMEAKERGEEVPSEEQLVPEEEEALKIIKEKAKKTTKKKVAKKKTAAKKKKATKKKADKEAPAKPVEKKPAEPVEEKPSEPVEEKPAEPVEEKPSEPVEEKPAKPVEEKPAEPVEETPAKPVEEAPAEPVEEIPPEPVEEKPSEPVEETPVEPTKEKPTDPPEEKPVKKPKQKKQDGSDDAASSEEGAKEEAKGDKASDE